jgi:hypothetical protein
MGEFIRLLKAHRVQRVIDVRTIPLLVELSTAI